MKLVTESIKWEELYVVGPICYGAFKNQFKITHKGLSLTKYIVVDNDIKDIPEDKIQPILDWFNERFDCLVKVVESKII